MLARDLDQLYYSIPQNSFIFPDFAVESTSVFVNGGFRAFRMSEKVDV